MRREECPVAEVAAAAHHRQVHAGPAAGHAHREDVDVAVGSGQAARLDRLLVQHARQRADAVAPLGCALVVQRLGAGAHALRQLVDHRLRLAAQEALGMFDIERVVLVRDQPDAGPRAAPDLVQQAGPRAVREHGVLAGAQPEDLLDQVDRLLHRPGAGIGPEVAVPTVDRAPVVRHAREARRRRRRRAGRRAADLQVRVALVVAEQDVEPRVQRLDQVVLEQQRLGLGAHHRGLEPRDASDHVADARAAVVLLEVARDPLLQVAGLADVQHLAGRVEVAVDAGQRRQRRDLGEQPRACRVGRVGGARVGGGRGSGSGSGGGGGGRGARVHRRGFWRLR